MESWRVSFQEEKKQMQRDSIYPCEVELGLYTDHVTFLLILCAQDLEFCSIQGRFRIDGIC